MKHSFAIIGYGGQGAWHGKQIINSDVAKLVGVFDIKDERKKAASQDGIHVYSCLEEILRDDEVETVVVATPNDSHKELVIQALRAGKYVICEKPAEMTVSAFDEMVAVSRETGRLFTVHQNRRWDVDYLAIKKIVSSGEIGDILRVESRVHGSRGIPSDWRCTKAQGGGMILDWGVHLIDQILQIIPDMVCGVYCNATHYTNTEVDDGFKLELFFENGVTAHVEVGTYNFLAMPRFYLQCKNGTALIEDWRKNAQVARMKAWNEKEVLPVQTAAGITKTMAPRDEITMDVYQADKPTSDVHDFYRNFCATVDGREELIVTPKQVRRVLQVMEAAFTSIESSQVEKVSI